MIYKSVGQVEQEARNILNNRLSRANERLDLQVKALKRRVASLESPTDSFTTSLLESTFSSFNEAVAEVRAATGALQDWDEFIRQRDLVVEMLNEKEQQ